MATNNETNDVAARDAVLLELSRQRLHKLVELQAPTNVVENEFWLIGRRFFVQAIARMNQDEKAKLFGLLGGEFTEEKASALHEQFARLFGREL